MTLDLVLQVKRGARISTGHVAVALTILALCVTACPGEPATTTDTTTTDTTTTELTTGGPGDSTSASAVPTTGGPGDSTGTSAAPTTSGTGDSATTGAGTGDESGETGLIPVPEVCQHPPPPPCNDPITKCKLDMDRDEVHFFCDNAPDHHNPDQLDLDGDGFGDIVDRCPTVASDNNNPDTDKDGVGNGCDVCPRQLSLYNKDALAVPFYMRVRNIPQQGDSDRDGIGDVCDNCVRAANCQGFGDGPGLTPFAVGTFIDLDAPDCQPDLDLDKLGDSCAGMMLPGAAGPVGFADDDDFDQDGVANLVDACPRQPVAPHKCDGGGDCPDGAACTAGRCNHADHDGDGVGDLCDTCPDLANPEQVTEAGAKLDDPDGDFIGTACERNPGCDERANARPFGFYDVSVGGRCCVTVYDGMQLHDPDGAPLVVDELGPRAAGVFELPPGCDEALTHSADGKAHKIEACNVDDPSELWSYLCLLPAWDQDYDDIPDDCDLCEFAYDPGNAIYIDANNKEWPNYGKYCHGAWDPDLLDPANMCEPKP